MTEDEKTKIDTELEQESELDLESIESNDSEVAELVETDSDNAEPDVTESEDTEFRITESDNDESGVTESDNTESDNIETEQQDTNKSPVDLSTENKVSGDEFKLSEVKQPSQDEMHFALIDGEPISEVPKDLYIPPDALEVFLEAFEGPLDLLLYLIKRQNLDILNIPIAHITEQYMAYVELMKSVNLELAAEYLVMAAMLAEIKSRVLLPRPKHDEEEDDPRADLIRRLQEYERFKKAALDVDEIPRMGRETFQAEAETPPLHINKPLPEVDMREILLALKDVLVRAEMFTSHQIQREALSTREKMATVLAILSADNFTNFVSLFNIEEGKAGVVVTFLAIMELTKESLIELVQSDPFSPIHVRARIQ